MAEAQVLGIADAVVSALNGHTFAAPYASLAASRLYVPVYNVKDLAAGLRVTVVPRSLSGQVLDRAYVRQMGYQIDVGFQTRVPGLAQATLDGLMALVESVGDFLLETQGPLTLDSGATATPLAVANDPIYDPKVLDEEQVFLSVLTVTYRCFR